MSTPASLLHSGPVPRHGMPPATLATTPDWKLELNARLREHRERRGEAAGVSSSHHQASGAASSRVAARVAERYSKAPTYQQLLTASAMAAAVAAESAAEAAEAAQEAAQLAARAAQLGCAGPREETPARERQRAEERAVEQRVPVEHGLTDPFFTFAEAESFPSHASANGEVATRSKQEVAQEAASRHFCVASVEHPIPLPERSSLPARVPAHVPSSGRIRLLVDAFAEAVVPAAQSLPAKLIEFPRELIAPRKQRPRLAEGPLYEQESSGMSLRIFEVSAQSANQDFNTESTREADSMELQAAFADPVFSGAPRLQAADYQQNGYGAMVKHAEGEYGDESRRRVSFNADDENTVRREAAPQGRRAAARQESGWGSIRLGEHPQTDSFAEPAQPAARRKEDGYGAETAPVLHDLAPISDRLMAALIDGGLVLSCFLLSALVFASCTVHPPAGKAALAVGLLVLGVMATFYGWLFMSYGGGSTPGMRYARIALCTFADENPTRKDLQNRVPATALALLPLGLGVFWALLDEDKLGWHDRMTRTYQRSYRV